MASSIAANASSDGVGGGEKTSTILVRQPTVLSRAASAVLAVLHAPSTATNTAMANAPPSVDIDRWLMPTIPLLPGL